MWFGNCYFITDKFPFINREIALGDFRLHKSAIERLKGVLVQTLNPPQQLDLEVLIVRNIMKVDFSEFKILVKIFVSSETMGGTTVLAIDTFGWSRSGNLGEGLGMLNIIFIFIAFIWIGKDEYK